MACRSGNTTLRPHHIPSTTRNQVASGQGGATAGNHAPKIANATAHLHDPVLYSTLLCGMRRSTRRIETPEIACLACLAVWNVALLSDALQYLCGNSWYPVSLVPVIQTRPKDVARVISKNTALSSPTQQSTEVDRLFSKLRDLPCAWKWRPNSASVSFSTHARITERRDQEQ